MNDVGRNWESHVNVLTLLCHCSHRETCCWANTLWQQVSFTETCYDSWQQSKSTEEHLQVSLSLVTFVIYGQTMTNTWKLYVIKIWGGVEVYRFYVLSKLQNYTWEIKKRKYTEAFCWARNLQNMTPMNDGRELFCLSTDYLWPDASK